jgi:large subunit ribosomal protein L4
VLVSDEVIFTETALAEFVAGPAKGKRSGVDLPDLATHEISGGVPSIAPAVGEGTVEETTEEKA